MDVSSDSVVASTEAPKQVGDAVLECLGLTRRYGERTVVDDVGFTIAAGETYGLLRPNGAGKTTTISMLCGLLRRDSGTVRVLDRDLDAKPRLVQGAIGYVPRRYHDDCPPRSHEQKPYRRPTHPQGPEVPSSPPSSLPIRSQARSEPRDTASDDPAPSYTVVPRRLLAAVSAPVTQGDVVHVQYLAVAANRQN